jgi:hypothetical protein
MRFIALAIALLAASVAPVFAAPKTLAVEAWRADLAELDATIRTTHPQPFNLTSESDHAARVAALDAAIPTLDDAEIVMRLAEIVAAFEDGHTRLTVPRDRPELGLVMSHSNAAPTSLPALTFAAAPVVFEKFSDGVYVVAASDAHRDLVGMRLAAVGRASAEDAFAAAKRVAFSNGNGLKDLMAAATLSTPGALAALGLDADLTYRLIDAAGAERTVTFAPIGDEAVADAFGEAPPLHARDADAPFFIDRSRPRVLFAAINEIGDADDERFAAFAAKVVAEAERRNAKLVVDLRRNFGGNGGLRKSLALAIARSRELNRWGRVFVLTGPRTFSAAQMLVNELEDLTRALFVGDATGSPPDHFGDPRKIALKNSGLTLRVSALHWPSSFGGDRREATNPDIPAPWTAAAYFAGGDPALEAAAAYKFADFKSLMKAALDRNDHYQVARYLQNETLFPDSAGKNFAPEILSLAKDYEAAGDRERASFAFRYGLAFFPDNIALKASFEAFESNGAR